MQDFVCKTVLANSRVLSRSILARGWPRPGPRRLRRSETIGQATSYSAFDVVGVLGEAPWAECCTHNKARDLDMAVKVPLARFVKSHRTAMERIAKEAESWIGLDLHPNCTQCYYVRNDTTGAALLFLELVAGTTWRAVDERRPLRVCQEALLMRPRHRGAERARLHHAHAQGLVHQDMKPENVLLTAFSARRPTRPWPRSPTLALRKAGQLLRPPLRQAAESAQLAGTVVGTLVGARPVRRA